MKNLVLVGFMGTGKSAVGRIVARRLKLEFVDMDARIEEQEGRTISDIFATEGEAHFRTIERAMVQELSGHEGLVIATGGGIVLNPDNIGDFSRTGVVICLHADPETILERVSRQAHRPLLEGDDKSREIRMLLEKRTTLYQSIPLGIDTTHQSARDVAEQAIALYLGQRGQQV